MRRLAPLSTLLKLGNFLVCLAYHVDSVVGRGPDMLPTRPIWGSPKVDCSLFRNESVLRPLFGVWPEEIEGIPFQYCCEYQPSAVPPSGFELSKYKYGPHGGALQPGPYNDLGTVDKDAMGYNLLHWSFWGLPKKQFSAPMLYCDVTDLQALYYYRLKYVASLRGLISFILVLLVVVISVILPKYKKIRDFSNSRNPNGYTIISPTSTAPGTITLPKVTDKEEAFSDFCHTLVLSLVGSCLMEGIAHSPIGGWRSQLMFNVAVVYSYLTLFAIVSIFIRHLVCQDLEHAEDWRWQKVFCQLAALMMMGMYLMLVEDVSGRSLDPVTGLVLGTCVGASIWSGGVEMVIIARALRVIKKYWLTTNDKNDNDPLRAGSGYHSNGNSLSSESSLGDNQAQLAPPNPSPHDTMGNVPHSTKSQGVEMTHMHSSSSSGISPGI